MQGWRHVIVRCSRGKGPFPSTAIMPAGSSLPSPTFCAIQRKGSATTHTMARLELGLSKQPSPFRMMRTRATPQHSQHSKIDEQKRRKTLERRIQRKREQASYQFAALAATTGIVALATFATYYRIAWHLDHDDIFPYLELASTLLLVAGGMVGMEMYARWAHKALWHENEWGWALHRSHHEPRIGPFEANDVFAIMNAVPAMSLCLYGFLRPDVVGGLCFGAGLGITLFGISYMFVHDGLVHRRFPVGPLANLPVLRRVAAAHQLHHTEKYGGVPFGMFLGPQELEAIGAGPELERLLAAREEDASVRK